MPWFHRRRPLPALVVLSGLLLSTGPVSAAASRIERPVTDAPASPAVPAAPAAPAAPQGSRAIPVTPSENPMREMAPGVYEGIHPVQLPDGSWLVHLDERFHAFTVVRRGDAGRLAAGCVHGAAGLARWRAAGTGACAHEDGGSRSAAATRPGAVQPTVRDAGKATVTSWEAR